MKLLDNSVELVFLPHISVKFQFKLQAFLTFLMLQVTFVCMRDCCVIKVGVVFSVVDKFQCRLGILSGFNLNLVFLPKLW